MPERRPLPAAAAAARGDRGCAAKIEGAEEAAQSARASPQTQGSASRHSVSQSDHGLPIVPGGTSDLGRQHGRRCRSTSTAAGHASAPAATTDVPEQRRQRRALRPPPPWAARAAAAGRAPLVRRVGRAASATGLGLGFRACCCLARSLARTSAVSDFVCEHLRKAGHGRWPSPGELVLARRRRRSDHTHTQPVREASYGIDLNKNRLRLPYGAELCALTTANVSHRLRQSLSRARVRACPRALTWARAITAAAAAAAAAGTATGAEAASGGGWKVPPRGGRLAGALRT
eukprot:COSAG01_NODE_817_length_13376_cov_2.970101_4_plen_289_part_00